MSAMPGMVHHVKIQDPSGEQFDGYVILSHEPATRQLSHVSVFSAKTGTMVHGMLGMLGDNITMHLQTGSSVEEVCEMLEGQSYSPRGDTDDPDVPTCTSVPNYIAQRIRASGYFKSIHA